MSLPATNAYHITFISENIQIYEDAVKIADALTIHLKRNFVSPKNTQLHERSCLGIMFISENDKKHGQLKVEYRGKKSFVPYKQNDNTIVTPHIHMFILANPGSTIVEIIRKYLQDRYGESCVFVKNCNTYLDDAISYGFKQSKKFRTIQHNVSLLAQETLNYIYRQVETINCSVGGTTPIFKGLSDEYFNAFHSSEEIHDEPSTLSDIPVNQETLINNSSHINSNIPNKLQCNIYKFIYINNKYNIYNKSDTHLLSNNSKTSYLSDLSHLSHTCLLNTS